MCIANLLSGKNVLICDDSITVIRIISSYLNKAGATVFTALNGEEGFDACVQNTIQLIISDINMPVMDGFQFFAKLRENDMNIPRVLMTDANIDEYINLVIDHDVGNILSKPIEMRELVSLCHKLITGEKVFGLINYIKIKKIYKSVIAHSKEIQKAIANIIQFATDSKLPQSKSAFLSIILDEVLSNAVYHAHGFTHQKEMRQEISLDGDDRVEICYGCNEGYLGIAVTDFKGALTKQTILKSFKGVIEEKKLIQQAIKTGEDITASIAEKGRGLQMIRLMTNKYYFNIQPGQKTQVIIIVELSDKKLNKENSSIKIQEIY